MSMSERKQITKNTKNPTFLYLEPIMEVFKFQSWFDIINAIYAHDEIHISTPFIHNVYQGLF